MKIPDDDDLIAALVNTLGITTATHGAILENLDRRWPYHGEHPGGRVGKVVHQIQEMREQHEIWQASQTVFPWVFFAPVYSTEVLLRSDPKMTDQVNFKIKFTKNRDRPPITDRDPGDEQP